MAVKRNGQLNPLFKGKGEWQLKQKVINHYVSLTNGVNQLFDMFSIGEVVLPYWLQPIVVIAIVCIYGYLILSRLWLALKFSHTLVKIDTKASELLQEDLKEKQERIKELEGKIAERKAKKQELLQEMDKKKN